MINAPTRETDRVVREITKDIAGEPHRVTHYASGRTIMTPLYLLDPKRAAHLERRKRMMGNSRREGGCGCGGD